MGTSPASNSQVIRFDARATLRVRPRARGGGRHAHDGAAKFVDGERSVDTFSMGGKANMASVSQREKTIAPTRLQKLNPLGPPNDPLGKDTLLWFKTKDGYATVTAGEDGKITSISPPTRNLAKTWFNLAFGGAKELEVNVDALQARDVQ